MSDTKTSSRSGSKADLNESAVPLLDDEHLDKEEAPDKESMEMKEKASMGSGTEKDDSNPEKKDGDKDASSSDEEKTDKKDKKKDKKKKDKKKKEKKVKPPKAPRQPCKATHCVQDLTVGLNMLDRDDRRINDDANITFEDVIAEPDATHSFDVMWRLSFMLFTGTQSWIYRIFAAFIQLPLSIVLAIIFGFGNLLHIWIFTPFFKIVDRLLSYVRRFTIGVVAATIEPVFRGIGAIRYRTSVLQEV